MVLLVWPRPNHRGRAMSAQPRSPAAAVREVSHVGADAALVEVLDHGTHRAQVEIAPQDRPDRLTDVGVTC